jgi:uncharacterized membrane protein HdeD (DUF308 family)
MRSAATLASSTASLRSLRRSEIPCGIEARTEVGPDSKPMGRFDSVVCPHALSTHSGRGGAALGESVGGDGGDSRRPALLSRSPRRSVSEQSSWIRSAGQLTCMNGAVASPASARIIVQKVPAIGKERVVNAIVAEFSSLLRRGWWLLLLRGLVSIAFGIVVWARPAISLAALVLLFGAYCLVDGVFAAWTAIAGDKASEYRWFLLLEGLLGIGVGIMAFIAPGITALALLFYIAIWAIATGVLEIVAAIRLRREIDNEWWLLLAGLASVAFGFILAARPGAGALALLWLIGSYAIVFGVLLLILAFKVRKFASKLT